MGHSFPRSQVIDRFNIFEFFYLGEIKWQWLLNTDWYGERMILRIMEAGIVGKNGRNILSSILLINGWWEIFWIAFIMNRCDKYCFLNFPDKKCVRNNLLQKYFLTRMFTGAVPDSFIIGPQWNISEHGATFIPRRGKCFLIRHSRILLLCRYCQEGQF